MTVTAQTPLASSIANGVTTVFPHAFTVPLDTDLVVFGRLGSVTTPYVLGVDYTVSGAGTGAGAVTFLTPPANGTTVVRYRNIAVQRLTDYQTNGDLLAAVVNGDFDRIMLIIQDLASGASGVGTALRLPLGETVAPLGSPADRAGKLVGFDSVTGALVLLSAATSSALALAVQLASSIGGTLVGFVQNGVGGLLRTMLDKMRERVSVRDFCVADGVADDSAAVLRWFAAAATSGGWADGLGLTVAVSGDVDLSAYAGLKLMNVTFSQQTFSATRKTLYALNNPGVVLDRVKVSRNGTGGSGALNTAAGIWLERCDGAVVRDSEVTGNDKGTAMVFRNCVRPKAIRPYVHDVRYTHTAEIDDQVQAVWFDNCTDFLCADARIENLGRLDLTSVDRDRYSRGIVTGGSSGVIRDAQVYRVGQAIDITGSAGNSGVAVVGGLLRHLYSAGVKFANTATHCKAVGVSIEAPGQFGILASGPLAAANSLNGTQNIAIDACTVRNAGCAKVATASGVRAFSVERQTALAPYAGYPKGVKIRNCDAISDEGASTVTVASTTTLALPNTTSMSVSLGGRVRFTTSGTLPTGLALATDYWLVPVKDTLNVSVATSYNNALDAYELVLAGSSPNSKLVSTLAGGAGTHTMTLQQDLYDGFFCSVDGTGVAVDTAYPNTTENCRSAGHVNKAFNGVHTPVVVSIRSGQSIANGAFTDLLPNNDTADSMGLHDATTPSADFTVPYSGHWRLDVWVQFAGNATGTRRVKILANGAEVGPGGAQLVDIRPNQGAGTGVPVLISYEEYLVRGTTLKAQAFQDSGGALNADMRITLRPATVHGGTI